MRSNEYGALLAGLVSVLLTMKTDSEERGVSSERHVAEHLHAILPLKNAFPIGLQRWCARRVMTVEVSIEDIYGLLVDGGFEFTGEKRGPGQLLLGGEE